MEILDDPEREFAASVFLRLEALPQAVFNKRVAESAFTTEKPSRSIHRARAVKVVTIHPDG